MDLFSWIIGSFAGSSNNVKFIMILNRLNLRWRYSAFNRLSPHVKLERFIKDRYCYRCYLDEDSVSRTNVTIVTVYLTALHSPLPGSEGEPILQNGVKPSLLA